ncbi:MAG: hypothetical protein J7519_15350 [Roseofilum sp. SID1]|uniref:hypothetical protein n=1 Tax=Roseofilum sp. SID1 TaxID=2821497 RepID=UPI001B08045E|nr:hypothetical protein [Roseofilum sp. SID1]MBP0039060.1 hypothetical protein [Roseofilum sp. SID1]
MSRRHSRELTSEEDLKIWTAFTDLMSNAFMILTLFLLLALIKSVFLKSDSETNEMRLQDKLQQRENEVKQLENEVKQLQETVERLKSPPVIVLQESQSRSFPTGSAELTPGLQRYIRQDLVKQIEDSAEDYQGYVVQVIGHTDGQENMGSVSNLDKTLEQVVSGRTAISQLSPGSNADLGLMRAVAVMKALEQNRRLRAMGLQFKAYSAAQLYGVSGNFSPTNGLDNPNRRRIEIRFTPPAIQR